MANFTYYCEIHKDRDDTKQGVYMYSANRRKKFDFLRLHSISDKIWRQGPRGGVRIIKDRNFESPNHYVTKDEKIMKEFMWVKLQAQPFTKGA